MRNLTILASAAVVALMAAAPAFAQTATNDARSASGAAAIVDSNDVYQGTQMSDIPVASAYAPSLWATEDTCMGSTSGGGQAMTFGFSFGTTWRDEDCVRRKDARDLYNMGNTMPALRVAALARTCQKTANKAAMHAAGLTCPGEGLTEAADTRISGEQIFGFHFDNVIVGPVAAKPEVVAPVVDAQVAPIAPEAPVVIVPRG